MSDEEEMNTDLYPPEEGSDANGDYIVLYPVEGLETDTVYTAIKLNEEGYDIAFLLRSGHLEETE